MLEGALAIGRQADGCPAELHNRTAYGGVGEFRGAGMAKVAGGDNPAEALVARRKTHSLQRRGPGGARAVELSRGLSHAVFGYLLRTRTLPEGARVLVGPALGLDLRWSAG